MPPKPRPRYKAPQKGEKPTPPQGPSPEIKDVLDGDKELKFGKIVNIYNKLNTLKQSKGQDITPETTIIGRYTYSELKVMIEMLDKIISEHKLLTSDQSEGETLRESEEKLKVLEQRAIYEFTKVFGTEADAVAEGKAVQEAEAVAKAVADEIEIKAGRGALPLRRKPMRI